MRRGIYGRGVQAVAVAVYVRRAIYGRPAFKQSRLQVRDEITVGRDGIAGEVISLCLSGHNAQ